MHCTMRGKNLLRPWEVVLPKSLHSYRYSSTSSEGWRLQRQSEAHQFLKSGIGGDGPSREKLKLMGAQHRAHRTDDPTVLQKVLLEMFGGEEFCTRDPHLEGVEVFGLQKRRPDTSIGDDGETYRPDIVNFSRPRPSKKVTRSQPVTLPTIIKESSPFVQEVQVSSPAGLGFHHVTAEQKTKVDGSLWQIARIPHTSGKSCWAHHAGTKKKCTSRIVTNNNNILRPTYTGMWHHYKLQSMKRMDFIFCPYDIERCIKGLVKNKSCCSLVWCFWAPPLRGSLKVPHKPFGEGGLSWQVPKPNPCVMIFNKCFGIVEVFDNGVVPFR
jgi:hypothetical protein